MVRENKFSVTKRLFAILVITVMFVSVMSLFTGIAQADRDNTYVVHSETSTTGLMTMDINIHYETLHVESGVPLTFFVTVTHDRLPVSNAYVEFNCSNESMCDFTFENHFTDADGKAVVTLTAYSEEGMKIDVFATASKDGYMVAFDVIEDITIQPPTVIIIEKEFPSYISITGIIALLIIASTETGKYGLFKVLVVPLYSRLKKDELLEHFVRGQIYGHIMSHPGEHYNHIKQKLGVTNGTLSHHLRTLELQGYIKSHRDGTYKRFYPTGMKIPRKKGIQLSDLQMGIVDSIRQSPGITQKEIALSEGISQQSVSYNLAILERMGILDSMRDGVRKKYFIATDA